MSSQQLTLEAMALPVADRASLAQALWESLGGNQVMSESDAVREAVRRDKELSEGTAVGRTHDEVMQAARKAIGCA